MSFQAEARLGQTAGAGPGPSGWAGASKELLLILILVLDVLFSFLVDVFVDRVCALIEGGTHDDDGEKARR